MAGRSTEHDGAGAAPTPCGEARSAGDVWTLAAKCLVATLLAFGTEHALEVWALPEISVAAVRTAHAIRGLAVAAIVGWIVARHYLCRQSASDRVRESGPGFAWAPEPSVVRRNAEWFVGLRWFAVTVVAASVIIAVPVTRLLPDEVLPPLVALTLLLVGANIVLARAVPTHGHKEAFVLAQVATDLTILTLLLHYSGGLENSLSAVYIFHVILAGILLPRGHAFLLAGVAVILYAGLGFAEMAHVVDHFTLQLHPHDAENAIHSSHELRFVVSHVVVMLLLLFCSTYFTTLIAGRLRRTERKLVGAAKHAVAEKLRLEGVVDASGAGLAVCDAEGRTEWRNARADKWLGDVAEFASTDGTDPAADLVAGAVATQRTTEREFVIERPTGGRRYLLVTATPVLDEQGEPAQVVELVQDVTARRVAEAGVAQTSKLAAIGELAGNVAHEVNNPVGVISAKARLLLQNFTGDAMPPKVAQELEKIVTYADRIAGITGGLLAFARPSSGLRSATDLNEVIRRARDFLEPRFRGSSVTVELALASDLAQTYGNSNELQQVVINLVGNAIDAMTDGGTIRITTRNVPGSQPTSSKRVVVEVADEGPGIPTSERAHVLEPFYTTKPEGRGTGLGLSICHGLVQSHKGTIEVCDAAGGGALIRVTLPVFLPREVTA